MKENEIVWETKIEAKRKKGTYAQRRKKFYRSVRKSQIWKLLFDMFISRTSQRGVQSVKGKRH